jgi:septal ring factor EnvC (AmiA/AmiB activator)
MNDRELLEFIAAQVGILTKDVTEVKQDMAGMKSDLSELKQDVSGLKKDVIRLEQKVDENLSALHDGRVQTNQILERIEAEVTKHDEFIMRRIK